MVVGFSQIRHRRFAALLLSSSIELELISLTMIVVEDGVAACAKSNEVGT